MKYSNNIVFINPPNQPFSSKGILIEPIDVLGLASWTQYLGHECSILDMDVKELIAQDLPSVFNHGWPKIMVIVFDYHIPLHDSGVNEQIKNICCEAKKHGTLTILGGKAATFATPEKLKVLGVDIAVAFEMEYALRELFEHFLNQSKTELSEIRGISYFKNKQFFINEKREDKVDLNELPISDRNLIDLSDYIDVRTMLSSRGCNLKCTFCHVPGFWGNWQGRNAQLVAQEIELLSKNFGVQKVLFLDDNATAHSSRMREISKLLIANKTSVALGCLGTINRFDQYTVELMQEAGFRWIHYGAESGDDAQLKLMGKKINAERIRHAVAGTRATGMRVRTSWIMDMPDLTEDGLKRTEELILTQGSEEIRLHFLTLRLGSILHNEIQGIETPQFIHKSKQNLNISGLNSELIEASVERILKELVGQGYTVVHNPHEFKDVQALKLRSPDLKIVSLCPLRYGLGWKY